MKKFKAQPTQLPPLVPLYISKIDLATKRFEVVASPEEFVSQQQQQKLKISLLKNGQELTGTIVRVMPYGAIIDVGAQINGILHISKVKQLTNKFVDKEKGMQELAGIVPRAKVRVSVLNSGKRIVDGQTRKFIEFDFTPATKEAAEQERQEEAASKQKNSQPISSQQADYYQDEDDNEDEDEEYYDEDRDIEDALGIGFY